MFVIREVLPTTLVQTIAELACSAFVHRVMCQRQGQGQAMLAILNIKGPCHGAGRGRATSCAGMRAKPGRNGAGAREQLVRSTSRSSRGSHVPVSLGESAIHLDGCNISTQWR